jgi:EAL domain-containing protein (putative c-di-GMP-specific phosphodiesterase class I)
MTPAPPPAAPTGTENSVGGTDEFVFTVGSGADRVVVVEPQGPTSLPPELLQGLRARMPAAFENGEIQVWYQPMVDMRTGRLFGAEALVRWAHPAYGVLGPGLFLPIATELGLIGDLSRRVVRRAVHQYQAWQQEGDVLPLLAINLQATDLDDAMVTQVASAVTDVAMPAGRLVLELTEQAVIPDDTGTLARMHQLRAFGVRFALDDFGTGFSSLAHLRDFPVDTVKIDRRFINGMTEDRADRTIVESMVRLVTDLGRRVVAEGVETAAQAQMLLDMGCHIGQGFLFSVPLPAEVLSSKLRRRDPTLIGRIAETTPAR